MDERASRMVVLGRVAGLFGVRGWVKVFSAAEPKEDILRYAPWYLRVEGGWRPYKVLGGQAHGKGVIAHLEHCPDRDAAARLVGSDIAVARSQLAELEPDQYYWTDLIGLQVVTTDGVPLGVVDHLFETGANDVLVVHAEEAGQRRERLIPYRRGEIVTHIDLAAGRIEVDWDPEF